MECRSFDFAACLKAREVLGFGSPANIAGLRRYLRRARDGGGLRLIVEASAPQRRLAREAVRRWPNGAILCLPASLSALGTLSWLARDRRLALLIEKTPLMSELFFRPWRSWRPELLPPVDLLAHAKTGIKPGTYVILFSDHHAASSEICHERSFLGHPSLIPLMEAMFYFRVLVPLVCMDAVAPRRLDWRPCHVDGSASFDTDFCTRLLDFVLGCMERCIESSPDDVLSWAYIQARTIAHQRRTLLLSLRLGEGILRYSANRNELPQSFVEDWSRRLQAEWKSASALETDAHRERFRSHGTPPEHS